jgi:hypothetical protein
MSTDASSSGKIISPLSYPLSETESSSSDSSTDPDIKMLEETFGKVDLEPKVQRIYNNPKSVGFTKNWYSRPTPPDLQFEERILQTQFSVSSDKIYEWNIDGLSEQELLNKMNHTHLSIGMVQGEESGFELGKMPLCGETRDCFGPCDFFQRYKG